MAAELSIFAGESGDRTGKPRYYLLTLVLHDQADDIRENIAHYEESLRNADLPNIPFHSEPLLNGHRDYELMTIEQRKKALNSFAAMVRYLPIKYRTFVYKSSEFPDEGKLQERMERDIAELVKDNLEFFQRFDGVKVYYDNGQAIVRRALDNAIAAVLSKGVTTRRRTTMTEYRLAQVADYFCTIELAAVKYAAKEDGATYNKFFGGIGAFKRNWLKQARRKAI